MVCQNLHFDVARFLEIFLHINDVAGECGLGFGASHGVGFFHFVVVKGDFHAFTAAAGSKQQVDFMHRTGEGTYRKGEGYTAAPKSLKYGRMVFVLPDEGVTPESLLQREGFLAELTECDDGARMVWSVPKFDVKSSVDLADALKALGVADAFEADKADFTPLTDNGAAVDSVMQAARVKIDEEGVEAAAYTEVDTNAAAAPPQEMPEEEMNLNRPFLFVIWKDGAPLVVGAVQTMEGM